MIKENVANFIRNLTKIKVFLINLVLKNRFPDDVFSFASFHLYNPLSLKNLSFAHRKQYLSRHFSNYIDSEKLFKEYIDGACHMIKNSYSSFKLLSIAVIFL